MADVTNNNAPQADDDDDDSSQADDFQQNDPDDINPVYQLKKDEELPGDYDTPFSPPSGVQDRIDATHPSTDDGIIAADDYDEGREGAADVDLPGETANESNDLPITEDDDEDDQLKAA